MEEEEAPVAAPNLAKATDELKATGGEDPLPAVLRAAQELQPQVGKHSTEARMHACVVVFCCEAQLN